MGKSFKRNGRWKKDRRDKGFRESKKFKEINTGHSVKHHPKLDIVEDVSTETDIDG